MSLHCEEASRLAMPCPASEIGSWMAPEASRQRQAVMERNLRIATAQCTPSTYEAAREAFLIRIYLTEVDPWLSIGRGQRNPILEDFLRNPNIRVHWMLARRPVDAPQCQTGEQKKAHRLEQLRELVSGFGTHVPGQPRCRWCLGPDVDFDLDLLDAGQLNEAEFKELYGLWPRTVRHDLTTLPRYQYQWDLVAAMNQYFLIRRSFRGLDPVMTGWGAVASAMAEYTRRREVYDAFGCYSRELSKAVALAFDRLKAKMDAIW